MGHMMCQLDSRVNIIGLTKSGTPAKAEGELTVEMKIKPGMLKMGWWSGLWGGMIVVSVTGVTKSS